jgi:signal transduction histidine kinase
VDALEVRNEFLAVAAHELKTPLAALRLAADLLLRTQRMAGAGRGPSPEVLTTRIYEQSGKLAQLIDQLLDVSRLEAGRLRLSPQPADLVPLLQGVLERVPRSDDGPGCVVQAPPQLFATVDALRLEQVLANLLDNARKFSPPSAPIEVNLRQSTPEWAVLTVRDYGRGIPEEHRAHIFERFYQVDPSQANTGLGLGLFISRQIVELHGGVLTVEAPPDGGTRFVLRLPLHPEREELHADQSEAPAATP